MASNETADYLTSLETTVESDSDLGPPYVDVSWHDIGEQLLITLIAQLIITLISFPLQKLYLTEAAGPFRRWVKRRMGSSRGPPKDQTLLHILFSAQFVCSGITVALWIQKTRAQEVAVWMVVVELGCCATVILHYVMNVLKNDISFGYINGLDAWIDVVTVTPLMYQGHHKCWLSFSFLRSWRVVMAYMRLEKTGVLDAIVDELTRGYIIALLKFCAFVFTLAAVTFVLEVLGDVRQIKDDTIYTGMGDISIYNMVYWIITTVSTVGYGDFSPSTMMSQAFIAMVIPAGVAFFTIITGELLEIRQMSLSGRGQYTPKSSHSTHVVVCGGAISSESTVTIRSFLEEMLHPNSGSHCPEIVLMSSHMASESLLHMIKEPWASRWVTWLRGHPVNEADVDRCKLHTAEMVFVLADIFTSNADAEDEQNALLASVLLKYNPNLQLRLMILRPENRELAVNLGVGVTRCFAINEIKALFISQSCTCPGFITLIQNLFKQDIQGLDDYYETTLPDGSPNPSPPTWLDEYLLGASYEMYGTQLAKRFQGMTFGQAAAQIYDDSQCFLIAMQVEGKMQLAPMATVIVGDPVVFVAAPDSEDVDSFRKEKSGPRDWKKVFRQRRDALPPRSAAMRMNHLSVEIGQDEGDGRNGASQSPVRSSKRDSRRSSMKMPWAPSKPKLLPHLKKMNTKKARSSAYGKPMTGQGTVMIEKGGGRPSVLQMLDRQKEEDSNNPDLLDLICTVGDHLVIIVQDDTLWQQVVAIVHLLRAPFQEIVQPIAVLSYGQPPDQLVCAYSNVVYHQGDPHKMFALQRVGVNVARSIIILGGRPSAMAELEMDRETLITASLVEKLHEQLNHAGTVILDLHNVSNLRQLFYDVSPSWLNAAFHSKKKRAGFIAWCKKHEQRVRQLRASRYTHYVTAAQHNKDPDESNNNTHPAGTNNAEPAIDAVAEFAPHKMWAAEQQRIAEKVMKEQDPAVSPRSPRGWIDGKKVQGASKAKESWMPAGVHEDVSVRDIMSLHPRFASGRVLSRADLVRFYAFAFYTPGCLEIVEAFADPERQKQEMAMTLMPVAFEHWNKPMSEVFQSLINSGVLLMGICRSIGPRQDNMLPYVYAFPSKDVVLDPDDKVYVIASDEWLEEVHARITDEHRAAAKICAMWTRYMRKRKMEKGEDMGAYTFDARNFLLANFGKDSKKLGGGGPSLTAVSVPEETLELDRIVESPQMLSPAPEGPSGMERVSTPGQVNDDEAAATISEEMAVQGMKDPIVEHVVEARVVSPALLEVSESLPVLESSNLPSPTSRPLRPASRDGKLSDLSSIDGASDSVWAENWHH